MLTQYHHPETSEVSIVSATDPATGGYEGHKRTLWRMIVGGTG